jgi:hypothetical protein
MGKKKPEFVTQTEFAKRVGVSQARISSLFSDGVFNGATVKEGKRSLIDVEAGKKKLRMTLDPTNDSKIRSVIGGGNPQKKEVAVESGNTRTGGIKPVIDFSQARTLNEQYKAAIRKLEYEEKTGKLVDAAKVREAAFSVGRRIRDALLNLPDRLAAILAAEGEEGKIREHLNREFIAVLEELSKNDT